MYLKTYEMHFTKQFYFWAEGGGGLWHNKSLYVYLILNTYNVLVKNAWQIQLLFLYCIGGKGTDSSKLRLKIHKLFVLSSLIHVSYIQFLCLIFFKC